MGGAHIYVSEERKQDLFLNRILQGTKKKYAWRALNQQLSNHSAHILMQA